MYVVSAFRSRACSTCVINAVLVVTVCGAFMAGVICGRMFTVAPTRPGKGSLCEDRESIDLGNVAHTGKMEENAATESSAGKGGSFVTKESLAFQLQNWTDALTVSMKRTMQKELQSLERRLRKRPVERCPKESAKIKGKQALCIRCSTKQLSSQWSCPSDTVFTPMTCSWIWKQTSCRHVEVSSLT